MTRSKQTTPPGSRLSSGGAAKKDSSTAPPNNPQGEPRPAVPVCPASGLTYLYVHHELERTYHAKLGVIDYWVEVERRFDSKPKNKPYLTIQTLGRRERTWTKNNAAGFSIPPRGAYWEKEASDEASTSWVRRRP
jgi:hypothetical protein